MLIAHETSFINNLNYINSFCVLLLFIATSIRISLINKQTNYDMYTNKSISEIMESNESIEHRIRFLALFQAINKPIIDRNVPFTSSLLKYFIIRHWKSIQKESYYKGYSHGVANSLKYMVRIKKDLYLQAESEYIYKLTTSSTGKALLTRNKAEYYFEKGEFRKSKECYYRVFECSIKSGNRLNAIKGLLGVAKCNKSLGINPLLNNQEINELKNLMTQVEGKNWEKHFIKVLAEVENKNGLQK
jgi:hypothetical protein